MDIFDFYKYVVWYGYSYDMIVIDLFSFVCNKKCIFLV